MFVPPNNVVARSWSHPPPPKKAKNRSSCTWVSTWFLEVILSGMNLSGALLFKPIGAYLLDSMLVWHRLSQFDGCLWLQPLSILVVLFHRLFLRLGLALGLIIARRNFHKALKNSTRNDTEAKKVMAECWRCYVCFENSHQIDNVSSTWKAISILFCLPNSTYFNLFTEST